MARYIKKADRVKIDLIKNSPAPPGQPTDQTPPTPTDQPPPGETLSDLKQEHREAKERKKYTRRKPVEQQPPSQEVLQQAEGLSNLVEMLLVFIGDRSIPATPLEIDWGKKVTTQMAIKYADQLMQYAVEVAFFGFVGMYAIPRWKYFKKKEQPTPAGPAAPAGPDKHEESVMPSMIGT